MTTIYGVTRGSFDGIGGISYIGQGWPAGPDFVDSFAAWSGVAYSLLTGGTGIDPTAFPWSTYNFVMDIPDSVYWSGTSTFTTSDIGFLIYGVNVQVPTSLGVLSYPNISLVSAGCLATDYGMAIAITYQVLAQNGIPLQSATMEPQEKILNEVFNGDNFGNPYPNWVDIYNPNYPGSTKFTNSSGQFLDAPFADCANVPFTETSTQPISMLWNGTNYTVKINKWTTVTTVPGGHGTMSNGSDIKASN